MKHKEFESCIDCLYTEKGEFDYPCVDSVHSTGTNEHYTTREPKFKWLYECYGFGNKKYNKSFDKEIQAMAYIEKLINDGLVNHGRYKFICKRKGDINEKF